MIRRLLHLALWAATVLIAACGSDGNEAESPPAERAPGQAVLGAAGGRLAGADGAAIVVPAGALPAQVPLSIARNSADAPPLPAPFVPASAVFEALPHGQTFKQPVAVTLPFDPAAIGAGMRPAVMKITPGQRGQLIVDGEVADGRITVRVKSFSYFTVVGVPSRELVLPTMPPAPDTEQSYLTLRLQNSWPSLPVTGSGQRLVLQPTPSEEAQFFVSAYVGSESAIRSMCTGDLRLSVVRAPTAVYRLPSDGSVGGINRIAVDVQAGRASRMAAYPQSNAEWLIYLDQSTGIALDRGYGSNERLNVAELQWNPPEEPETEFFFSSPPPTIDLPADAIVDNWGAQFSVVMSCAVGWSIWDLVLPVQPVVVVRGFPVDDIIVTFNPPAVTALLEGQSLNWPVSANAPPGTPTAGVWQQRLRGSSTWTDVPPLSGTSTVVPPGLWMWNGLLYGAVRRQDDGTTLRLKACTTAASPVRCAYSAEGQLRVSTAFPPPAVVSQPPSRTFNVGDRLDLPFTFRGLPLPTRVLWQTRSSDSAPWTNVDPTAYQSWFDGRVDPATFVHPGTEQTTDHLKGLQPLTLADRGRQFRASYTTVAGSVTSQVATIGVTTGNAPPLFTTQPADASVAPGSAVIFATAVTGAQPISYQWLFNGVRIPGANAPMLTLSGVNAGNGGLYQLEASNVEATVRSNPVRLSVSQGATSGQPPTISGQPTSITVPAGAAASFAVAAGPGPLSYQWAKDGTLLPGATEAAFSIATVAAGDAGAYSVTVANAQGVVSSAVAQLVVGGGSSAAAPAIATQPVGLSVVAGQPALLAVGASGSGPLSYRWQRDGSEVAGATGPVLRIDAAQASDAGNYTVIVSNGLGAATSNPAGLVVTPAPGAPRVDEGPGALTGLEGGSVTFTATVSGSPAPLCLWLRNGIVIPGATSCASYTMGPLTRADDGVIVNVFAYNAGGHVFARGAALTVVTGVAPSITRQPVSQTWAADAVVFSLDVAGTPLPRVTWAADGERLADSGRYAAGSCSFDFTGAWSPMLVITQVSAGCVGTPFVAFADNAAGRATSDTVTLVAPTVVATSIAGLAGSTGSVDGAGDVARFNTPNYLTVASDGSIAIGDFGNSTIRILTPPNVVKTFAGTPGVFGFADGPGTLARFAGNGGLAYDRAGNLFVSDWDNHVIRRITPEGVVTTFAGTPGAAGSADGSGAAARFRNPNGLAIDGADNLYVVDWGNHTIRRITPAGEVSTFAGSAGLVGSADGVGTAARFRTPGAVAIDGAGNLYVTDMFNHTVRKITPAGEVSTLAGQAALSGTVDGTGSAARFDTPAWIAATADGTLFVVSAAGDTVRRVSAAGVVETVVGVPGDNAVLRLGSDPRLRNARGVWAVSAKELLLSADQSVIRVQLP